MCSSSNYALTVIIPNNDVPLGRVEDLAGTDLNVGREARKADAPGKDPLRPIGDATERVEGLASATLKAHMVSA